MRRTFERIYRKKVWYNGSGSGSLPKNTRKYRAFLRRYLKKNKIRSVLDLGCGDWQFMKLMDWRGIEYLGVDVVPSLVRRNQATWGNKMIHFRFGNVPTMRLPKADLVILKDVLQHWSNFAIRLFLPKLKKYNHVLIVNTVGADRLNTSIRNGDARPLDLAQKPFNQPVTELLRWKSYRPYQKIWETKSLVRLHH